MNAIIMRPSITEQWQALIQEATSQSKLSLNENLESYLVFLLMRFTKRPEIAKRILALEFLQSMNEHGKAQSDALREVGDQCLLASGLFPGRAVRKNVRISYFVELGKSAYALLADISQHSAAKLYEELDHEFVSLMDVLHVIRELSGEWMLTPLEAEELWQKTNSQHALSILKRYTKGNYLYMADSEDKWH